MLHAAGLQAVASCRCDQINKILAVCLRFPSDVITSGNKDKVTLKSLIIINLCIIESHMT